MRSNFFETCPKYQADIANGVIPPPQGRGPSWKNQNNYNNIPRHLQSQQNQGMQGYQQNTNTGALNPSAPPFSQVAAATLANGTDQTANTVTAGAQGTQKVNP